MGWQSGGLGGRRAWSWWSWLLAGLVLSACGAAASPPATTTVGPWAPAAGPKVAGRLTVFAAASLTEAFTELGRAVEAANPDTTVTFSFAGSATLRTQLREGARADLFAAADEPTMRAAQQDGSIGDEPRVFARNTLIVIVAQPRAGEITRLQDLARPGLKLVLAQATVPVGNYARQSLAKMADDIDFGVDFSQRVLTNLVSEEGNVRQVVSKVQLGEADAGIVYASDVTPEARQWLTTIEIPDRLNVRADYPIAPVTGAQNPDGARAFVDYVLSPAGQAVLQRWGFIPVGPAASPPNP